jgi:nitrous oxidase accessory protein
MTPMQTNKKFIFIILLVCVASIYLINTKSTDKNPYNSANITVYSGDSIQQVINSAKSGDTIIVSPGLYKENLILDKSLVMISQEGRSANTVIEAEDPEKDVFHVTSNNVTIKGFNITGAQSNCGIYYRGSYGNIANNTLIYNKYGILLKKSLLINSKNVTIENNVLSDNENGIYLRDTHGNCLENNSISNGEIKVNVNGIYLENSDNNKLVNNNISNSWRGIYLIGSSNNELNKNIVSSNYFSIDLLNSNNNRLLNNLINLNAYTFSVTLGNSHYNILKGNNAGSDADIKVFYTPNSKNNVLEGEQYSVNEQHTGGILRVK